MCFVCLILIVLTAKLGAELAQYQANSTASTTITQLGDQTQYIPIVPTAAFAPDIVHGELPTSDSEGEAETETDRLRAEIVELRGRLDKEKESEYFTPENRITSGPLDDTEFVDERIEALEREREDFVQAKQDQIEELQQQHQREKAELVSNEAKLREKLKKLRAELDKASGFNETGASGDADEELRSENAFLQRQNEEFADELERTLNQEEDMNKENLELQEKLVALRAELDTIKAETPERFGRLVTGFGAERKEFDEVHEKIFDENEQLRKSLQALNVKVKEFTQIVYTSDGNKSVDMSQLGKWPFNPCFWGAIKYKVESLTGESQTIIYVLQSNIHSRTTKWRLRKAFTSPSK